MNTTPETDETLTACDPYGQPYTKMFTTEEWQEMTQEERQAIIDEDIYRAEKEAEEEAAEKAKIAEHDELLDAYEAQREEMKAAVVATAARYGWTLEENANGYAWSGYALPRSSEYATLVSADGEDEISVRLSDHPQGGDGSRGGFSTDAFGNGGTHMMAEISIEAKPGEAFSMDALIARLERGA